jgi:hypothetical protein
LRHTAKDFVAEVLFFDAAACAEHFQAPGRFVSWFSFNIAASGLIALADDPMPPFEFRRR